MANIVREKCLKLAKRDPREQQKKQSDRGERMEKPLGTNRREPKTKLPIYNKATPFLKCRLSRNRSHFLKGTGGDGLEYQKDRTGHAEISRGKGTGQVSEVSRKGLAPSWPVRNLHIEGRQKRAMGGMRAVKPPYSAERENSQEQSVKELPQGGGGEVGKERFRAGSLGSPPEEDISLSAAPKAESRGGREREIEVRGGW